MKHLADLIRQGLAANEVHEDNTIYGAGRYQGRREANIIGLMAIAKVGWDEAAELFEAAIQEVGNEPGNTPVSDKISQLLGLRDDQCEELVMLHQQKTAAEIADGLESGSIRL